MTHLLEQRLPRPLPPVRLLGMGVSGLDAAGSGQRQQSLFGAEERARQGELDALSDEIQERFGRDALQRGAGILRRRDR